MDRLALILAIFSWSSTQRCHIYAVKHPAIQMALFVDVSDVSIQMLYQFLDWQTQDSATYWMDSSSFTQLSWQLFLWKQRSVYPNTDVFGFGGVNKLGWTGKWGWRGSMSLWIRTFFFFFFLACFFTFFLFWCQPEQSGEVLSEGSWMERKRVYEWFEPSYGCSQRF